MKSKLVSGGKHIKYNISVVMKFNNIKQIRQNKLKQIDIDIVERYEKNTKNS